nr:uncharacterized protein LOC100175229 [Ciona intestinalis]|eukprot:XP_009861463.2 uncharacterized protein LOC100175229 [Ciona intestinalis]
MAYLRILGICVFVIIGTAAELQRVGKAVKERDLIDTSTKEPVILHQYKAKCNGEITSLNFHAASESNFVFQVWRPWGYEYKLLHSLDVLTKPGINKVDLLRPIPVVEGDTIGLCPMSQPSINIFTLQRASHPIPVTFYEGGGFFLNGASCEEVQAGEVCAQLRHSSGSNLQRRVYSINAMIECYPNEPEVAATPSTVGTAQTDTDCVDGNGVNYRGKVSITRGGIPCQKWSSGLPHVTNYSPTSHPGQSLEENFCRNPDGDANGPWCYTMDPGLRHDYCSIPACGGIEARSSAVATLLNPFPFFETPTTQAYSIGYDVKARPSSFGFPTTTIILTNTASKCDGRVESFSLWATVTGAIKLQVWRYSAMVGFSLWWESQVDVTEGYNKISFPISLVRIGRHDVLGFTSLLTGSSFVSYTDGAGDFYLYSNSCWKKSRGQQCKGLMLSSPHASINVAAWANDITQSFLDSTIAANLQRSAEPLATHSLIREFSIKAEITCDQEPSTFERSATADPNPRPNAPKPVEPQMLPPPGLAGFGTAVNRNFVDLVRRSRTIFLPGSAFSCNGILNQLTVFLSQVRPTVQVLYEFVVVQVWRPGVYTDAKSVESLLFPEFRRSGFRLMWETPVSGYSTTAVTLNQLTVPVQKGDVVGFTTKSMFGQQSSSLPFDTFGGQFYASDACSNVVPEINGPMEILSIMSQTRPSYDNVCFDFVSSRTTGSGRRTYSINANVVCQE